MALLGEVQEIRPCYVQGEKMLFHRFADVFHKVQTNSIYDKDPPKYTMAQETLAIVENQYGMVSIVRPELLVFADGGGFDKYAWLNNPLA